jgi:hypothetical protein
MHDEGCVRPCVVVSDPDVISDQRFPFVNKIDAGLAIAAPV